MKELPKKYNRIIKNDEKVVWYDKPDILIPLPLKIFLLIIILIFILLIILLLDYTLSVKIIIFSLWILIFSMNIIFKDFNFYIATDKRIYIKNGPLAKVKQYNYSRIHCFKVDNNDIIIYAGNIPKNVSESNKKQLPRLINIQGKNNVKKIIEEHWFPQSPYQMINNEIEKIAKKYKLKTKYFHPITSKKAELRGKINGLNILVTIESLNNLEQLTIAINCPNTENNYLKIAEETIIEGYKKMFGTQDLKVGNTRIDHTFLFQSDHQVFFDYVMTDEIQQSLLEAWKSMTGIIEMGDAKNIKNKPIFSLKKKKLDDVLDDHLLDELPEVKKKTEGLTSTLVYHSSELNNFSNNSSSMTKNINIIFETVLNIALRIQEYDKV